MLKTNQWWLETGKEQRFDVLLTHTPTQTSSLCHLTLSLAHVIITLLHWSHLNVNTFHFGALVEMTDAAALGVRAVFVAQMEDGDVCQL